MSVDQTKLEAKLRPFKDIIPNAFEKELTKAFKDNDNEKVASILKEKINPILETYVAKTTNENLNEGEQIIWLHQVTKGIFKKEVTEKWMITNLRVIKHIFPTKQNPKTLTGVLGLAVLDCVVTNQSRSSKGSRIGTFTGVGGGGVGVGTAVGSSSSTSQTYGDLVFFFDGKEGLRFRGISDPNGVRQMIQTLKKQTKI